MYGCFILERFRSIGDCVGPPQRRMICRPCMGEGVIYGFGGNAISALNYDDSDRITVLAARTETVFINRELHRV